LILPCGEGYFVVGGEYTSPGTGTGSAGTGIVGVFYVYYKIRSAYGFEVDESSYRDCNFTGFNWEFYMGGYVIGDYDSVDKFKVEVDVLDVFSTGDGIAFDIDDGVFELLKSNPIIEINPLPHVNDTMPGHVEVGG